VPASPTSQPEDCEGQLQLLCQVHPGLFSFQAQQTPHCGCTRLRAVCKMGGGGNRTQGVIVCMIGANP
jgi:hypothetical protein